MADVLLILAGPAVGLALVAGYLLGRRSNVQRQIDAWRARETALPTLLELPAPGRQFEQDAAAFKLIETYRMTACWSVHVRDVPIALVAEPSTPPATTPAPVGEPS